MESLPLTSFNSNDAYPSSKRSTPGSRHNPFHPKIDLKAAQDRMVRYGNSGYTEVKGFMTDFKKFVDRGNVIDLAIGIIMGSAFTAIVNSLVGDIVIPLISLASGRSLEETFVILRQAPGTVTPVQYTTRLAAKTAGALTLNWGNFIETILNFFVIATALFFGIKLITAFKAKPKPLDPTEKKCDYCSKDVAIKALRCPFCTTWLDKEVQADVENEVLVRQGEAVVSSPPASLQRRAGF